MPILTALVLMPLVAHADAQLDCSLKMTDAAGEVRVLATSEGNVSALAYPRPAGGQWIEVSYEIKGQRGFITAALFDHDPLTLDLAMPPPDRSAHLSCELK